MIQNKMNTSKCNKLQKENGTSDRPSVRITLEDAAQALSEVRVEEHESPHDIPSIGTMLGMRTYDQVGESDRQNNDRNRLTHRRSTFDLRCVKRFRFAIIETFSVKCRMCKQRGRSKPSVVQDECHCHFLALHCAGYALRYACDFFFARSVFPETSLLVWERNDSTQDPIFVRMSVSMQRAMELVRLIGQNSPCFPGFSIAMVSAILQAAGFSPSRKDRLNSVGSLFFAYGVICCKKDIWMSSSPPVFRASID